MSDERLMAGVRAILAEAEADIGARKPVCQASGRCCKFEAYGHRMYVTGAEAAYFAETIVGAAKAGAGEAAGTSKASGFGQGGTVSLPQFFAGKVEGCPYQVGGLCAAREARPLGCRVYFCDANAQGWQAEVYEKYHGKLKALHEEVGLAYRYVEWRAALKEMVREDNNGA